ncbi:glutamate--tRNA ligase, cytoplasmic-like isoform X1 [Rutidosis leptorrhynchoides]|uniref:glutamate--tRNA ligase, cytoplasmic-like isoform X1 n=1 Tax=Rutidosis leptorrhynchoides TaxID=125765 RepID=UPI003A99B095
MELKLLIASDETPPLWVLAVARLAGVSLAVDRTLTPASEPVLVLTDGIKLRGTTTIIRYLCRTSTSIPNLYERDAAIETGQIDEWLEYAPIFSSGFEYEGACKYVDEYLLHHTFLVGNSLSVADVVIWSYLTVAGKRWESLLKSTEYQNLVRWYTSITTDHADVLDDITATYTKKKDSTKTKSIETQTMNASNRPDVDLPDAEMGKVCLRFAPEPSGYLHIGHAKAALLNQFFADKYKGQLNIRFDDTNPSKESSDFVDNILKDINTLGVNYEKISYTSDHFPKLIEMAEKLIKEGKAYVDDTPCEEMKNERWDGIESACRNNTVNENMNLWNEMILGSERGLICCLRGKLDMKDPNKSLRDPVYYRCNPIPHHRIGSRYKLYPTYDFACPFVDSIEGITHALRSSEYHDRNAQYLRIQEDMGIRKVHIYEFSRLNMVYTLLSKRMLRWFVKNGRVDGWDDARFPTVQGIVRRGLQIDALIQFVLDQGASKNLNLMEWDKLWNMNKKIIDPVCPRHTAIHEDQRVMLTLLNGPETPFVRIIPKHKKYAGAGDKATICTKKIWIEKADLITKGDVSDMSPNEEITLMDWGNAIVKEIKMDSDGNVTELIGVLHPEGSVKTTKRKLTWLPVINELVPLTLVEFDYLIKKRKLEKNGDFVNKKNKNTKKEIAAIGDSNMRYLKRGDIIQLERKGYFRCDVPLIPPFKKVVLYAIPDGRQIGTGTKPNNTKIEIAQIKEPNAESN